MKKIISACLFSFCSLINAGEWSSPSTGSYILVINAGGNGGSGTYIALDNYVFPDNCGRTEGAFLKKDNPDYETIYSILLAAKLSNKPVRVYSEGCAGIFRKIKQISLY